MYEKLEAIIEEHEKVIEVCKKMSRCLSPNVLIHYITSALITCICCLMITLAEGAAKIIFVNYIIASTTQVFVYSIGGNLLEDASTGISFSAYDFPWYKCDERIRKTIQMIMIRGQKKTAVDVPFFEASLETFSVVSVVMPCCVKICESNDAFSVFHLLLDYQNSRFIYYAPKHILTLKHFVNDRMIANNDANAIAFSQPPVAP